MGKIRRAASTPVPNPVSRDDALQAGQRVLAVLRNGGGYAEEIVLGGPIAVICNRARHFWCSAPPAGSG